VPIAKTLLFLNKSFLVYAANIWLLFLLKYVYRTFFAILNKNNRKQITKYENWNAGMP